MLNHVYQTTRGNLRPGDLLKGAVYKNAGDKRTSIRHIHLKFRAHSAPQCIPAVRRGAAPGDPGISRAPGLHPDTPNDPNCPTGLLTPFVLFKQTNTLRHIIKRQLWSCLVLCNSNYDPTV